MYIVESTINNSKHKSYDGFEDRRDAVDHIAAMKAATDSYEYRLLYAEPIRKQYTLPCVI